MINNQSSNINIDELRKLYPNMGKKWEKLDDELLKSLYLENRQKDFKDFEEFVKFLTIKFGRTPVGIKARMAMHFQDVPGWDYDRDKNKKIELDQKTKQAIGTEHNDWLKAQYYAYSNDKDQTYMSFILELSAKLGGVKGELIRNRLEQLVGKVEKFSKGDVNQKSYSFEKEEDQKEIPDIDLTLNQPMREALKIMDSGHENLFLTGEAGTGKSTLLKYFRATTKKNVVVLAPTGVAALNVEGQTIHSFCGFGPNIILQKVKHLSPWSGKKKLLNKVHTIIIDEISMVRADLLDCVDRFLRLNGPVESLPFGGIQMVFIGDLYQLPPVEKDFAAANGMFKQYNSPYFFDALSFKKAKFLKVHLQQVYRQKDQLFVSLLNAVRNNIASTQQLEILNRRSLNGGKGFTFEKFAIYLTPTNARAQKVNNWFLEKIQQPLKTYTGIASGSFEDRELPTDLNLQIKIGAQIMMLSNDKAKRWVNGTMGKIIEIEEQKNSIQSGSVYDNFIVEDEEYIEQESSDIIIIELETGEKVSVSPHTWEMFKFVLNKDTQKINSQTVGTFTQYPFKLAWAVTIHKAQGKTFNKVFLDLASGTFAHGQLYVALSRCRTLEGLFLKRPVVKNDIILDQRIVDYMND